MSAAPAPLPAAPGIWSVPPYQYRELMRRIIRAYDSPVVRAYSHVRFTIININILHILGLCLRGKRRVLDIGCGFGLFGCYFSAIYPDMAYHGYDVNGGRIDMARLAAQRLGLTNTTFTVGDARTAALPSEYDAIITLDLFHHIDDAAKRRLIEDCAAHLSPGGRLIIKDVTRRPVHKLAFTWALDALMTRSNDMWYWSERTFHDALSRFFVRTDTYPIADWLPYPHIVYLSEKA